MRTKAILRGGIVGPIWWPTGAKCAKELTVTLDRDRPLYEELADVLNDGDFQAAYLTADSYIELVSSRDMYTGTSVIRDRWTHSKFIEITTLPSIKDLVDEDAWLPDFLGEDY